MPRTPELKEANAPCIEVPIKVKGFVNHSSSLEFRCMLIATNGSTIRVMTKKTLRKSKVKKFIQFRLEACRKIRKRVICGPFTPDGEKCNA